MTESTEATEFTEPTEPKQLVFSEVAQAVAKLGALKFFPADVDARLAIAELFSEICYDIGQVRWLVKRIGQLYNEYPGPQGIRGIACGKFRPKDGIECNAPNFPDGVPSEDPERNLIAAPLTRQIAGTAATSSPSIAATLHDLAGATAMNRIGPQKVREIPARRDSELNITQADIDAAVLRMREQKAREEIA